MVTTIVQLKAELREDSGKGVARALRREGKLPAVIYGGQGKGQSIATDYKILSQEFQKGHFTSKIVELEIGNEKIKTLPRDVQLHPVTDKVLHVDFQRVNSGDKLKVLVQVVFKNADKSPGLKRGGVLNIVRRDIELMCDVDAIPSKLVVDLDGLQIGESVHVSSITIPGGATPTITDRDFTIATIVGRMAKVESDAAPAGDDSVDETAEGEAPEAGEEAQTGEQSEE